MGMIASLKAGYKLNMLSYLFNIFDNEGGYESAAQEREIHNKGCRGTAYGGEDNILDDTEILDGIWDTYGKYANTDGIKGCWRKVNILPADWSAEINNEVGSY